MSNVSPIAITLDASSNVLLPPEPAPAIRLSHKCAGAFLHRAAQAAQNDQMVLLDEVAPLWRIAHNSPAAAAAPDRTAIKRLIDAVERALAQLPAGAARLHYAPRAKTVGPWRLVCAEGVRWRLEGADAAVGQNGLPTTGATDGSPALPDLPTLLAEPARTPPAISAFLQAVNRFSVAEDALRRGDCAESVAQWRAMLDELALSHAGQALTGLRLARALRRAGRFAEAQQALRHAALQARAVLGRAGDSLRAECALMAARLRFDVARADAVREIDFSALWQQTQQSLSHSLQAQWANLNALVVRRRLLALHEAGAPMPERMALHERQLGLYEAAMFWLLEDGDAYTLQAVAINLANYLNGTWMWLQWQGDTLDAWQGASLRAFALGHALLDRFDLPQDSAWDFIMLAQLYMDRPEVRAWLHEHPLAWPSGKSPADAAFYQKSIQIAEACGDRRQLIVAWDQLARWRRWHQPNLTACHEAVQQVEALMQQDAKLAADLKRDGFVPTRLPA